MKSCYNFLKSIAALLVLVQLVMGLEDTISSSSIDTLTGNELCNLKTKKISQVTTIKKLIEAFESASDVPCRHEWLHPLRDLQGVIDESAIDACSLETINKIEVFYWHYVVGTLSKKWREASDGAVVEPLRLFFIHFVRDTMDRCKLKVGSRLRGAVTDIKTEVTTLSDKSVGSMLTTISVALVPAAKIKKFDDFFLIYNAIINSERKKGYLIEETVPDSRTGEVTYFSVKVNDASRAQGLQEKCREQLRPLYSNTVLPVMKLIDLGFGTGGQSFYQDEELLAQWYEITQLCEFVLPIKFYSNPELRADQIALVKDEEEVKLLQDLDTSSSDQPLPPNAKVTAVHLDDTIPIGDDERVLKRVKSNFRSRARIYRKTLKNTLSTIKSQITSRVKSFFVSKRKNNKFVLEDDNIAASIAEAEKKVAEEEQEERRQEGTVDLVRRKRADGDRPKLDKRKLDQSKLDQATLDQPSEENEMTELKRKKIKKRMIKLAILIVVVITAIILLLLISAHVIAI